MAEPKNDTAETTLPWQDDTAGSKVDMDPEGDPATKDPVAFVEKLLYGNFDLIESSDRAPRTMVFQTENWHSNFWIPTCVVIRGAKGREHAWVEYVRRYKNIQRFIQHQRSVESAKSHCSPSHFFWWFNSRRPRGARIILHEEFEEFSADSSCRVPGGPT